NRPRLRIGRNNYLQGSCCTGHYITLGTTSKSYRGGGSIQTVKIKILPDQGKGIPDGRILIEHAVQLESRDHGSEIVGCRSAFCRKRNGIADILRNGPGNLHRYGSIRSIERFINHGLIIKGNRLRGSKISSVNNYPLRETARINAIVIERLGHTGNGRNAVNGCRILFAGSHTESGQKKEAGQ